MTVYKDSPPITSRSQLPHMSSHSVYIASNKTELIRNMKNVTYQCDKKAWRYDMYSSHIPGANQGILATTFFSLTCCPSLHKAIEKKSSIYIHFRIDLWSWKIEFVFWKTVWHKVSAVVEGQKFQ